MHSIHAQPQIVKLLRDERIEGENSDITAGGETETPYKSTAEGILVM
jgi:hypothetical protein